MPFEPFVHMLRICGRERGFSLMAIFVARHADCPWAFEEINQSWSSLHDLTGNEILFLTLDAKNSSPIDKENYGSRLKESTGRVHGDYGIVAFTSNFRLMQTLDAGRRVKEWSKRTSEDFVEAHARARKREDEWADDHTLGISEAVRSLYGLTENDVPCIYFEGLDFRWRPIIISLPKYPNSNISIYGCLKALIGKLNSFKDEERRYKTKSQAIRAKIENAQKLVQNAQKQIQTIHDHYRVKYKSGPYKKLLHSVNWLCQYLHQNNNIVPDVNSYITNIISGCGQAEDVEIFIKQFVSQLNINDYYQLRAHLIRLSLDFCSNRAIISEFRDTGNISIHEFHQFLETKINPEKERRKKEVEALLASEKIAQKKYQQELGEHNQELEEFWKNYYLNREDREQIFRQELINLFNFNESTKEANMFFEVALSFPGEHRAYVEKVASQLSCSLGKDKVFYDNYHKDKLARPNLDTFLLNIYRNCSKLIVIFLCEDYQKKNWCGLESRAIRDLILNRADDSIMLVRIGSGNVDGFLSIDGYIDGEQHTPAEVTNFILERLNSLVGP